MANPKLATEPNWYGNEDIGTQVVALYRGGGLGTELLRQVITLDGGAGSGAVGTVALFTITGTVLIRLIAVCTTNIVEGVGGGTIEVGIASATAAIVAQTTSTNLIANEIWHDATPDAEIEAASVLREFIISDGNDIILTVAGQDVTGGVIGFYLAYVPLSGDGAVVAA